MSKPPVVYLSILIALMTPCLGLGESDEKKLAALHPEEYENAFIRLALFPETASTDTLIQVAISQLPKEPSEIKDPIKPKFEDPTPAPARTSLRNTKNQDNKTSPQTHFNIRHETMRYKWPLNGSITVDYHDTILGSHLKVDHVVIETSQTNIMPTESGKVIYAKWMPDLGLTIIIDHGNDYHSIYGNCDRLLVSEGDHVQNNNPIGEFIAGRPTHSLYFAIRHKGHAIDPKSLIENKAS